MVCKAACIFNISFVFGCERVSFANPEEGLSLEQTTVKNVLSNLKKVLHIKVTLKLTGYI